MAKEVGLLAAAEDGDGGGNPEPGGVDAAVIALG